MTAASPDTPVRGAQARASLLAILLLTSGSLLANDPPDTDAPAPASSEASNEPPTPAETAAVERTPLPTRSQQHQLWLEQAHPEAFRTLETALAPVPALYQPANLHPVRGTLILLPGNGQNADDAWLVTHIRSLLPDSGWNTLSLQLDDEAFVALQVSPLPQVIAPTEDTPADDEGMVTTETVAQAEQTPAAEPPEDLPPDVEPGRLPLTDAPENQQPETPAAETAEPGSREAQIIASLDAALNFSQANTTGTDQVILGIGEGAYWASLWLSNKPVDRTMLDALLLLHARAPADASTGLPGLTGPLQLPVADFFDSNSPVDRLAANARQQHARRNPHQQYQAIALKEPAHALRDDQSVRRIKGWLHKFSRRHEKKAGLL